ncbi:hypothetical protein [Fulvivirga lutimaris]|uniref:hypothetical protein n=1 Tax=Fulvivirga lutimaris TaxID=1819566 RepID=UPI0012BB5AFE|nr:hypothetical protein [Fulvivirga lutimaris]MTI40640.1 hypothetical protein [Fulvivirga lutimaris]
MSALINTMADTDLIKQLTELANRNPENLYELSLEAVSNHPEYHAQLKDAQLRLQLAKVRELMDDHQIKLAYRVTVRNLIKELEDK